MNARFARVAVVVLVLVAACSDGGGGGTATDGTGSTSNSSGIEAGVPVPAGVNWSVSDLAPVLPATSDLPSFEQVTATAGVPPAPAGYPFRQSDYIRNVFVFGDVQLATGTCGCWQGGDSTGVFGGLRTPIYLFRSMDAGATWAQVNLSGVLGDVNGHVDGIVEHDGALILTATTSDAAGSAPTEIDVLRSADGATWELLGSIASDAATPVSVEAFQLFALGSSLVLYGGDMACQFDGSNAVQNIGPAYQARFWASTDGGVTWAPKPPADTGLDVDRASLPDAATCDGIDIQGTIDAYGSMPRLVSVSGEVLSVWSADGQRIVSTADGTTWSSVALDGAMPLPSVNVPEPVASSKAGAIVFVDGQYLALNLEDYRNIDDTATGSSIALSVVAWTSVDGASWQRQPLGRPILTEEFSARYEFFLANGRLGLRVFDPVEDVEFGVYESVAGVSEDWSTCTVGPGVNCSFSTELSAFEPGADLAGIDLSFTSLEGRDLTDVSFVGARLRGTDLSGTILERTDFTDAQLTFASLTGDVSTSVFEGATLTGVRFGDWFLLAPPAGATVDSPTIVVAPNGLSAGISLVDRDLSNYSFTDGSLAGVDFSGSDLTGASFAYTDLTGAVFTGATLDGVFFFDVTCPDGAPMTEGASGAAVCRL